MPGLGVGAQNLWGYIRAHKGVKFFPALLRAVLVAPKALSKLFAGTRARDKVGLVSSAETYRKLCPSGPSVSACRRLSYKFQNKTCKMTCSKS